MHTRHKSGHLETIYLAYITYTLWTVLYSSYMYFCEFFIVITILLLFGFASSLAPQKEQDKMIPRILV